MEKPLLYKPKIGGDFNTWGLKLNKNVDEQDLFNRDITITFTAVNTELSRLDRDKISFEVLDTYVKTVVNNYIEVYTKPDINIYVEFLKNESIKPFVEVQKTELNEHTSVKKSELDSYSKTKESEITVHSTTEKGGITSHANGEKLSITDFSEDKKGEITVHTNNEIKKVTAHTTGVEIPRLTAQADLEIERINSIGIDTKQDKIDQGLQTNSKDIVGAINENKRDILLRLLIGEAKIYTDAKLIEDALEMLSPTKKFTICGVSKDDLAQSTTLAFTSNFDKKYWIKTISTTKNDTLENTSLSYMEVKFEDNSL